MTQFIWMLYGALICFLVLYVLKIMEYDIVEQAVILKEESADPAYVGKLYGKKFNSPMERYNYKSELVKRRMTLATEAEHGRHFNSYEEYLADIERVEKKYYRPDDEPPKLPRKPIRTPKRK